MFVTIIMERMEQNDIIIYNTDDGKSSVVLVGADGRERITQDCSCQKYFDNCF